jgi:LuxR family quorum-sensing system transcriptional regulator CciR
MRPTLAWTLYQMPRNISVADYLDRLDVLVGEDEIWRHMTDFARDLGFSSVVYSDGSYDQAYVAAAPHVPDGRDDHCRRKGCGRRDPVDVELTRTTVPFTFDELWSRYGGSEQAAQILHEHEEAGLKALYCVPLRSPRNTVACMMFGSDQKIEIGADSRAALRMVAHCTDIRLHPPLQRPLPRLSERERECLEWVARGKSDHDIADILQISAKTVNFHIEAVKRKYEVSSRTAAVAMAARAGIIAM